MWNSDDREIVKSSIQELGKIHFIDEKDVLDSTVIRTRNAYPAYFGTYNQLPVLREFTDRFENLFLIGRNGMHRYNNMDHSMQTAITAVRNIAGGIRSKDAIWEVSVD